MGSVNPKQFLCKKVRFKTWYVTSPASVLFKFYVFPVVCVYLNLTPYASKPIFPSRCLFFYNTHSCNFPQIG